MLSPAHPPRDQLVTSSDLVRHFGVWQDRAAREPVYVLHRGRPRFVLTSIELMEALCLPQGSHAADHPLLAAILDGTGEIVIVADAAGRIVATSRAARAHFGTLAASGEAITALTGEATRPILAEALARVAASGIGDRIELPSATRPLRHLALALSAFADGIVLFGADETTESELRDSHAAARAMADAIAAHPGAAIARINLRGHVEQPGADLAALVALPIEALAAVRFVTLIDIAGRVAVAEAIEDVIANGRPRGLDATLLVNRAAAQPVRIGLAARYHGTAIAGLSALLVAGAAG